MKVERIKQEILKCLNDIGVEVKRIILFGSRARGEFRDDSDWDILITLEKNFVPREKRELWYMVYTSLHKCHHNMPFDIIIKSEQSFEDEKTIVNTISNEAYLEGVEI